MAYPRVTHIVGAIVTMGNAMLTPVVADAVETAADIEALAVLGDVDLQGFYFSRPQPSATVLAKLATWRAGVLASPQQSNGGHRNSESRSLERAAERDDRMLPTACGT